MPSKGASAIRTALQSINAEIDGIVNAFDEEEKFLESFSVHDEKITETSVTKVESIKSDLKASFEDFETAEAVANRDNLRGILERLVEKQTQLDTDKMTLLEKESESDALAKKLKVCWLKPVYNKVRLNQDASEGRDEDRIAERERLA